MGRRAEGSDCVFGVGIVVCLSGVAVTFIWGDICANVGVVGCHWSVGVLVICCDDVGVAVHFCVGDGSSSGGDLASACEYASALLSVVIVDDVGVAIHFGVGDGSSSGGDLAGACKYASALLSVVIVGVVAVLVVRGSTRENVIFSNSLWTNSEYPNLL